MTRYLVAVNYAPAGMEGLVAKGGSARREMIDKMMAEVGGTVESFDFAFGPHDAYLLVDVPDPVSVAAVMLRVGAAGAASCQTTVLLSPEDVDRAAEIQATYTPPGS